MDKKKVEKTGHVKGVTRERGAYDQDGARGWE
jgi:hypothetical protein